VGVVVGSKSIGGGAFVNVNVDVVWTNFVDLLIPSIAEGKPVGPDDVSAALVVALAKAYHEGGSQTKPAEPEEPAEQSPAQSAAAQVQAPQAHRPAARR